MDYILTNCRVLDGTENMAVRDNLSILVRSGKIEKIFTGDESLPNVKKIDLNGRYLMPGLIDLHSHMVGTGKPIKPPSSGSEKKKGASRDSLMLKGVKLLEGGLPHKVVVGLVRKSGEAKLFSGVTTVRTMSDLGWSDVDTRNGINSGKFTGPRLLVSGIGISVPGGHMAGTMARACATAGECRKAVDDAAGKSVDWIKIFVTGGVLDSSDSGEPARLRMSLDLASAACERAHELGYRVASHAESQDGVRVSLLAGVDSVEHGAPMDDEIIKLYKKNNANVTLTISPAIAIAKLPGELTGMDDSQRAASNYVMNGMIEGVRQALENGIPVGLGTDASCPYVTQYDMWREVYYFSKYLGVSPSQAIFAATLGNARILRIENETGSIEEGKSADMIVLEQNPLDDLTRLRSVKTVIMRGEIFDNPKLKRNSSIDDALDSIL